ncbi:hypothetical protein [Pontibacter flavimaris]|uniref:Uncharacterized protein n=1 Tax=Pontibacter flavimaris TaxID=1797110 RepID=A0A1Q5PCM1_9BACT|nr:hypothetical protein [Pontibacter flavimaris]OKL39988.1 hypothetical protein A3841_16635 [Pontibacter flavimaris]
MATKVIDKNEARLPFFGDKMSFVTGLDPLGLQNPSAQAYSYLLPGLNNVTGRIRNYSFYCWLLAEYAKRIKSSDPKEQKTFIRKAEYIIALIAAKSGILGISGSLYATHRLNENLAEFNLNAGTYNADGSTVGTYWQYGSGVFGQYYIGSLRQIGLIEEPINDKGQPMGIYRRTAKRENQKVSGEEIAAAFDKNISGPNKQLFFNCLEKGTIDHDQLIDLTPDFNMAQIRPDTEEARLLLLLLLDVDEPLTVKEHPESMRKETLLHVLRLANELENTVGARLFTMHAYEVKGRHENTTDASLSGWYYYQFNEYWQFACTAIFNGLLDFLDELAGPGWKPVHELIQQASDTIIEILVNKDMQEATSATISSINTSAFLPERKLYSEIEATQGIERVISGFLLIWKMYDKNKENLVWLWDYTKKRDIGGGNDVLSFYREYDWYKNSSIKSFVEDFLLKRIIQRHQKVAYHKMGNGSQSTQKFIIEENYIRKIGNFGPGFTGPRVGNLIAFLQDLHLLDANRQLTEFGELVLIENN